MTVWGGIIIEGYNQYEICTKHSIPFSVREIDFLCRNEAISWICTKQLCREDISSEMRKYLIGKQYNAEKLSSNRANIRWLNRCDSSDNQIDNTGSFHETLPIRRTASRLSSEYAKARSTIEKYGIYAKAIDKLSENSPDISSKILSGQYKISHENVVEISKLSPIMIRRMERKLMNNPEPKSKYYNRKKILSEKYLNSSESEQVNSVKDMPVFDPDADINGLTLSIPSWASSIDRVSTKTNLSIISKQAKDRLIKELRLLTNRINELISAVGVD